MALTNAYFICDSCPRSWSAKAGLSVRVASAVHLRGFAATVDILRVACHPKLSPSAPAAHRRASRYGGQPSPAIESEGWCRFCNSTAQSYGGILRIPCRPAIYGRLFTCERARSAASRLMCRMKRKKGVSKRCTARLPACAGSWTTLAPSAPDHRTPTIEAPDSSRSVGQTHPGLPHGPARSAGPLH